MSSADVVADHGVAVVGELSAGFPPLGMPSLGDFSTLLLPAPGVLLVGYTDNVLTGRAFAVRGGYEVDADQEFLALGAANVGSGLLDGPPGRWCSAARPVGYHLGRCGWPPAAWPGGPRVSAV